MFYSLNGTIAHFDQGGIAVDCGGVAYYCHAPMSTIAAIGEKGDQVFVYTYLKVSDNAMDLYGFATLQELSCFKLLLTVTGIGPKAAMSLLSSMTPEQLALSVAAGDYKFLTSAQGIGPKLAQRIVLELKDKVQAADVAKGISSSSPPVRLGNGNLSEAISALVVLGYGQSEAAAALSSLPPDLPVEQLIKEALKALAKGHS